MKRIVSLLMSLVIAVGVLCSIPVVNQDKVDVGYGVTALAADSQITSNVNDGDISFNITGTENYDYANSVFEQINALRASLGLNKLTLDEKLMEIAMQRAAEIAVFYSHTRPNDASCFSFSIAGNAYGENIASGYRSPEDVMYGWANSSGHYANMVSSKFNAVGVGCFMASDGTFCWVQYFSGGATPTKADISGSVSSTRTISAKMKNLDLNIVTNPDDISLAKAGDSVAFSVINRNVGFSYQTQEISSNFTFESSKNNVIEIDSNGVGAITGNGTTEITATLKGAQHLVINQRITVGHTHSFSVYFSNNDATCASDGTKTAFCDYPNCRETDTVKEYGTRLDHSYIWTVQKEADVYSAGIKQEECYVCGYVAKLSEIDQLKCSKPALKTIENTEYGVLVKWSKVKGGDYYRVYRKTKNSEWEYLDSTKNGYFTDKTAKSGTKYYYAVRARNEAGNSSRSSSLSKYYLEDPTLNTPSSTSKGIGLRWSKVNGAEGYMVYRKTADGSYKRITTEEGISNVTFRDTSTKKGTKYYYKVKAYYSKTYSAYSNTKAITDKY